MLTERTHSNTSRVSLRRPRCVVAVVSCIAGLLALTGGTAAAQTVTAHDPAGDGEYGDAFDITRVTLSNEAHRIVVRTQFVQAAYGGSLAVFFRARQHDRQDQARVVSVHKRKGDRNWLDTVNGRQQCPRLKVTWNHADDFAVVSLPARCFLGGNYHAVAVRVLTEVVVDADIAPDGPHGRFLWTRWAHRERSNG